MAQPTDDILAAWPLWWFARLETALERDDGRAAAEAIRNLERLGIEVRFRVPPRRAVRRTAPAARKLDWEEVHRASY